MNRTPYLRVQKSLPEHKIVMLAQEEEAKIARDEVFHLKFSVFSTFFKHFIQARPSSFKFIKILAFWTINNIQLVIIVTV